MKKMLLTLTAMLALTGVAYGQHHHHHNHFNKQWVTSYTHALQQEVENMEAILGACHVPAPGVHHALEDSEELCELLQMFDQKLHQFNSNKFTLANNWRPIVDLAEHMDELICDDHSVHSVWGLTNAWYRVEWYIQRISFQLGVQYHNHH